MSRAGKPSSKPFEGGKPHPVRVERRTAYGKTLQKAVAREVKVAKDLIKKSNAPIDRSGAVKNPIGRMISKTAKNIIGPLGKLPAGADFSLPKESFDKGMRDAKRIVESGRKLSKYVSSKRSSA